MVVSTSLLEQFRTSVKGTHLNLASSKSHLECLSANNGICDVQKTLQGNEVPLEMDDIDELCRGIVRNDKNLNTASGVIFSSSLLSKALVELGEVIEKKAQEEADRLEKEKKQQKGGPVKKAVVEEDDEWGDSKKGKKKGGKAGGAKGKKAADEEKTSSGTVGVDSAVCLYFFPI